MIRKATEQDLPRLSEINVFAWRTAYRGIIPDEYLFKERSVITTAENMARRLNAPGFEIDIFNDGIIKGFAIHHPEEDGDIENACDLMALYVEPQFQGQGIGGKLIRSVEVQARERHLETMIVWTLEKNGRAIGFYEKQGYSRDGKREYKELWNTGIIRLTKGIQ